MRIPMALCAVTLFSTAAAATDYPYPCGALGSMEVQMAAAGHRTNPMLAAPDQVTALVATDSAIRHRPVDADRLEILKRYVAYARAHRGDDPNPTIRDFDISMMFEKDCAAGRW